MAHAPEPIHVIRRSKLKRVEFTLAAGDIFEAGVDAIVSSEQTDFVLSGNPESLSGQIWNRYGDAVQRELDEATQGQVVGPGTVIDTSGGTQSTSAKNSSARANSFAFRSGFVVAIATRAEALLASGSTQSLPSTQPPSVDSPPQSSNTLCKG